MDEWLASLLSVVHEEQQHFLPPSQLAAGPATLSHFQEMKLSFFLSMLVLIPYFLWPQSV